MSSASKAFNESTNADDAAVSAAANDQPAAKKARGNNNNNKSPYDQLAEALEQVSKQQGDCGYMLVKGVDVGDDYDNDASSEEQKRVLQNLPKAAVDVMRVIMMPKERADAMEEMAKLILGEQYGDSFMMFNTTFSYEVLSAFDEFKRVYNKTKNAKEKLNLILGFTSALEDYDVWMHDHEVGWGSEFGGGKMISGLARMWKNLLGKYSAQELGLDTEFSEPGVKAFLKNFKKTVESVDMYDEPSLKFKFE